MRVSVARLIRMWMREGEELRCLRVHRMSYPKVVWGRVEPIYQVVQLEYYLRRHTTHPVRHYWYDFEVQTNQRVIRGHHHVGRTWIWDSEMPELEPRKAVAPYYDHNPLDDPWADGWLPPD